MKQLKDGEPCDHPGCLSHVTHPCEGCGRIAGHKLHDQYKHPKSLLECDYVERHELCCCQCRETFQCLGKIIREGSCSRNTLRKEKHGNET